MFILSFIIVNIFFGVLFKIYLKLSCGFFTSNKHLVGKVVIVTGGNAGIGYETAYNLAERGAKVILACRDATRGEAAAKKIRHETGNREVHYRNLDLASLRSVREFAANTLQSEQRLDVLINNAGAMGLGQVKTEDGLLAGTQINHFGPFLLTNLLLPLLKSSAPSRIINVSSMVHTRGQVDFDNLNMEKETPETFSEIMVYANSKLYNILFTIELDDRLKGTGVTVNALHPGAVITDILKKFKSKVLYVLERTVMWMFYKSAWEGCQTSVHVAVDPTLEKTSGLYFSDCKPKYTSRLAADKEVAKKLWEESARLVKLKKDCRAFLFINIFQILPIFIQIFS